MPKEDVFRLSDRQWEVVAPCIPTRPTTPGRPPAKDRAITDGIIYVIVRQKAWQDLPPKVYPPYTTCFRRYTAWVRTGVWGDMLDALFQDLFARKNVNLWRLYPEGKLFKMNGSKMVGIAFPPEILGDTEEMLVEILFLFLMEMLKHDEKGRQVKKG